MGKLHQWEFAIGQWCIALVYHPKEWVWCVEDTTNLPGISWWIKAGPVAVMRLDPEPTPSWLDLEM